MKTESGGLTSRIKSNPVMTVLVVALVGFASLIAVILVTLFRDAANDQAYLQNIADLRASSYQLTSLSRDATAGDKNAFVSLTRVINDMDATWRFVQQSDSATRAVLSEQLDAFDSIWSRVKQNTQIITANEDSIILMHDVAATLNEALPELQTEHDNIVEILLENEALPEQISVAQRQSWFAERIGRNVDKMLLGGLNADQAADAFHRDASRFGKVLTAMKNGAAAIGMTRVSAPDALESLDLKIIVFC